MKEDKVLKDLLAECMAYLVTGHDMKPVHVMNMVRQAYQAGGGSILVKCWGCENKVSGVEWTSHQPSILCKECKNKEGK